jgi:hypothetical protein
MKLWGISFVGAYLAFAGGLQAATLQEQVDKLEAEIKYIRDNYQQSEPVEIVKPVTEYVSKDGEIFSAEQKEKLAADEQARLEERVTYRKIKFNRRESVNDKIDSAISAAMDGRVTVGMELSASYMNGLGKGDMIDNAGATRSANRGFGSAGANVNFSGKPMRNTIMFADFDASGGSAALGEAWVALQGPRKMLSLQAGFMEVAGAFDTNKAANDDVGQFVTDEFVNSRLVMSPGTGAGAIVRVDFTRLNFLVGAQDARGAGWADDAFDTLYWIGEIGLRYHLLGDMNLRLWARQQPRLEQQPDQALGVSYDHRVTPKVTLFGRYAKNSYVEDASGLALNSDDWSASGGLELGFFAKHSLRDKVGAGFGQNSKQGGHGEQFAELYYKKVLTPNFQVSLIGQGTFSRTVAMNTDPAALDPNGIDPNTGMPGIPTLNDALPNDWKAGVRTVFSY